MFKHDDLNLNLDNERYSFQNKKICIDIDKYTKIKDSMVDLPQLKIDFTSFLRFASADILLKPK